MVEKSHNHAAKQTDSLRFLLTLILIVTALYEGRSVLLPLALSVLIAFILTPLVMLVQNRGLARTPAVLVVLCFFLFTIAGAGYVVGLQVRKLTDQLPQLAEQANVKINKLRTSSAGPISRAIVALQGVGDAAEKSKSGRAATQPAIVAATQEPSAFDRFSSVGFVIMEPVADAALIFILVAFMLVRREDLRNRIIGLLGHGRLTGTTRVFVESAERISRLLLMQLCVNISFGLVFGLVLLAIGVKYCFLWGFLTALLRFVPYIGTWLAAMFPVLLSFADSAGWGQPIAVFATFMSLDLVTGNVIEPLLFGHSTGVTPVALLVAAVFWAWVWGPLGLVLSTPLTVCLVVMGQNIPSLRFLSLLMGDKAALEPHAAYYQRLLAGDRAEAVLIARRYGSTIGWDQVPDGVVLPALKLARRDRKQAGLNAEDEAFVIDTTEGVIESLREASAEQGAPVLGSSVLGCAAHHRAEELAVKLLSSVLAPACCLQVISTRTLPVEIEERVDLEKPAVVFIAILPPGGVSQARHLCKRLRKRFADLKIVVGYFGNVQDYDRLLTTMRSAGASYVSTSILQSRNQIRSLLSPPAQTVIDLKPSNSPVIA